MFAVLAYFNFTFSRGAIAMVTDLPMHLSRNDIEYCIKEREPFFKIWDALLDKKRRVLMGFARIEVGECEGHFPDKTYVPLVRIEERMAQTGLLLVGALTAGRRSATPIAIGHGSGTALAERIPRPALDMRIEAREASWLRPLVVWQKLKIFAALRRKCWVIDLMAYGKWGGMTAHIPVASLRVYYILIGVPRTNTR